MSEELYVNLEESEEGTEIIVKGEGAIDKAKRALELSETDKEDMDYVRIQILRSKPDEKEEKEEKEEEPVSEGEEEYELRRADKAVLRVLLEKDRFMLLKDIYQHVDKRHDIADTTAEKRIYDLVDHGYIERRRYPKDRRKRQYKATSKAEQELGERLDISPEDVTD